VSTRLEKLIEGIVGRRNGARCTGLGCLKSSIPSDSGAIGLGTSPSRLEAMKGEKGGIFVGLRSKFKRGGVVGVNGSRCGGVSTPGDGDIKTGAAVGKFFPKISIFADGLGKLCAAGLMLESGIQGSLAFLLQVVSRTTQGYGENDFENVHLRLKSVSHNTFGWFGVTWQDIYINLGLGSKT
jgi:hypothetical protein